MIITLFVFNAAEAKVIDEQKYANGAILLGPLVDSALLSKLSRYFVRL